MKPGADVDADGDSDAVWLVAGLDGLAEPDEPDVPDVPGEAVPPHPVTANAVQASKPSAAALDIAFMTISGQ